jgi:hypothetical protein
MEPGWHEPLPARQDEVDFMRRYSLTNGSYSEAPTSSACCRDSLSVFPAYEDRDDQGCQQSGNNRAQKSLAGLNRGSLERDGGGNLLLRLAGACQYLGLHRSHY